MLFRDSGGSRNSYFYGWRGASGSSSKLDFRDGETSGDKGSALMFLEKTFGGFS